MSPRSALMGIGASGVPRLGSLRVHESTKRLCRALDRGAIIQSVGSSLVRQHPPKPRAHPPRRRPVGSGPPAPSASTSESTTSPRCPPARPSITWRHLDAAQARLTKAQRALSRTEKGSARRRRAAMRVGRLHHEVAEQRATILHTLTKRLASSWATVAIEDLNVAGIVPIHRRESSLGRERIARHQSIGAKISLRR
jgi:putative transposase